MKNNSSRNDKIFDIILEESFDKYANDIAENDVACEMSEEEIKTMEDKEKTIYDKLIKDMDAGKKSRISVKKICVLVAVLLLGIIVVSFGASAVNIWIQRTNVSQDGTNINITTQKLIFADYNNIKNFENKNVIVIPNWLPDGMELNKINDDEHLVVLSYKKNNSFVTITIAYDFESETETIDAENNNYTIREANILGAQGKIVTMTSETGLTAHSVFWNSDNTSYRLMTNVTEEELNKILENLIYFEE